MRRVAGALLAWIAVALAPAARAVDLEGTWYVLVHFQDKDSNKPDAWRWEDRVWNFAKKGDRLEWTEYPIVTLQDESGRFERLSGNRAARVVTAWEPNPAQLADIKDGLAVNSRGVKSKELRSTAGGTAWKSGEGGSADSAMVITYSELWSIEGLPERPVFTREDSMGSAATESMEGRTQYRTETVAANGEELSGSFDRDGTRSGKFRLIRSGPVSSVGSTDQGERMRKVMTEGALRSGLVSPEEVGAAIGTQVKLPPEAKSADRTQSREAIRKAVEGAMSANGNDEQAAAPIVDGLSRRIERALFDEDKSVEEVQRLIATGQLGP